MIEWNYGEPTVLVRACGSDLKSFHRDFQYPSEVGARVTAPYPGIFGVAKDGHPGWVMYGEKPDTVFMVIAADAASQDVRGQRTTLGATILHIGDALSAYQFTGWHHEVPFWAAGYALHVLKRKPYPEGFPLLEKDVQALGWYANYVVKQRLPAYLERVLLEDVYAARMYACHSRKERWAELELLLQTTGEEPLYRHWLGLPGPIWEPWRTYSPRQQIT